MCAGLMGGKGEPGIHSSTSGPDGSNTDVLDVLNTYLVVGEVASIPAGGRGLLRDGAEGHVVWAGVLAMSSDEGPVLVSGGRTKGETSFRLRCTTKQPVVSWLLSCIGSCMVVYGGPNPLHFECSHFRVSFR